MLKKDKMVSCGAPGYTNRADNNSNIITLVTITIMLRGFCTRRNFRSTLDDF